MSKVTNALKRKFGPLPAWAWFLLLIGALYFYRKYRGASGVSGTGTGSVAPAPGPQQPIQVLQPGESAYDPNTGALTTAPGGGAAGDTTAGDLAGAMDSLANAIATGMPPTQVEVTTPTSTTPGTGGGRRGKGHGGKHNGKGKSKGQTNSKGKTSKGKSAGHKSTGRSNASARNVLGGRTGRSILSAGKYLSRGPSRAGDSGPGMGRSKSNGAPSRARAGSRTPAITTTVRQRPVAQHPRQSPTRQAGGIAPRPSAPPPRTQRSPSRPVPPRQQRRRGR